MDIGTLIKPELLVLVPVLLALGLFFKQAKLNSKWIPLILGGTGVALAVAYMVLAQNEVDTGQAIITGVIQGILCAAVAVYGNQIVKQLKK